MYVYREMKTVVERNVILVNLLSTFFNKLWRLQNYEKFFNKNIIIQKRPKFASALSQLNNFY